MSDDARVWEALRTVIDPELGVNLVDLGLVYEVIRKERRVHVRMTVTTPACPMGSFFIEEVEAAIRQACPELETVEVELVFVPLWGPERISPEGREQLGWAE